MAIQNMSDLLISLSQNNIRINFIANDRSSIYHDSAQILSSLLKFLTFCFMEIVLKAVHPRD